MSRLDSDDGDAEAGAGLLVDVSCLDSTRASGMSLGVKYLPKSQSSEAQTEAGGGTESGVRQDTISEMNKPRQCWHYC